MPKRGPRVHSTSGSPVGDSDDSFGVELRAHRLLRESRRQPPIEMNAFDLGIRGQHLECAAHGFDRRGIVSRADNDPRRCGHALSDASNERVLAAVGYCLGIQNEGAKSPAVPCGEVE